MTEKILGLEKIFVKHHDLFSFSLELVWPETKGSNMSCNEVTANLPFFETIVMN